MMEQMNRLWNKDDERSQEDKLRLAGFPPPDEPEDEATVKRRLKLSAAPNAKKKQEKVAWEKMSSWEDDEGKEASSSWEPHSEGSEGRR